ncbi:hypothetical protein [Macrococcoides caseolyticum]|uniref:hypothetical protein n=1 Tax=Macrococcoides caseolyticum TaxID=69966 RepID=UPI000C33010A|nr:hypothetical protein [Macrococcus caseolyticus]PKE48833.1 hypothetical protein CW677_01430 [Macrococcus caseolyticus]PKF15797.1 hypothetical protein CW690_01430 [Macrococcus caseolyticus]
MENIQFDNDMFKKANEYGRLLNLDANEIETIIMATCFDLNKREKSQVKTDKQKRDEILAIENDEIRTIEIAKNLKLFGGRR